MKTHAPLHISSDKKMSNSFLDSTENLKSKTEIGTKCDKNFAFIFTVNEGQNLNTLVIQSSKSGTMTLDMTKKNKIELNGNNVLIPINSLINNIDVEEEGEENKLKDFNANYYNSNFKDKKI